MEVRDIQQRNRYRELLYSALSVITLTLLPLYWYITSFDLVEYITQNEEIPLHLISYLGCFELLKISLVLYVLPPPPSYCWLPSNRKGSSPFSRLELGNEAEEEDDFEEIPKIGGLRILQGSGVLTRDEEEDEEEEENSDTLLNTSSRTSRRTQTPFSKTQIGLLYKVLKFTKGIIVFLLSVVGCHVLVVLFGAPFFADYILTFQFSFILATWLFLPLCVHVQPTTIPHEIIFMRLWNTDIEWIAISKCRFIVTVFGAGCGAIAFPLDWDRPWQKWPIPCLVSTISSYYLFHCICFLHVAWLLYGKRLKEFLGFHSLNKVKTY